MKKFLVVIMIGAAMGVVAIITGIAKLSARLKGKRIKQYSYML